MQKIIITTTNTIEGVSIEKYYGLVTANLVIGTNIFSDFVASFSDFFGGMSGTYKKQLQLLYKRAIDELTANATSIGANAVVGVKMDFDEISGKGKSMFMVSIYGTAVRYSQNTKTGDIAFSNIVDSEKLNETIFLNAWKPKLPISSQEWQFILSHKLPSLAKDIILCREELYHDTHYVHDREFFDVKFKEYISKLDEDDQINAVYYGGLYDISFYIELINLFRLFSPSNTLSLIKQSNLPFAISTLTTDKPFYDEADLVVMKEIVKSLDYLTNGTEDFSAPTNSITAKEESIIVEFKTKVEALEMLLNSKTD